MSEDVSHPAHGLDVIGTAIRIPELFPHLAHVHIDTSIKGGEFSA
jgi:hypothetical protein